jgi:hypothetical protein
MMKMPTREIVRTKNLFNVSDVIMINLVQILLAQYRSILFGAHR